MANNMQSKFNLKNVPLGTCSKCDKLQLEKGEGGMWFPNEWICWDCKQQLEIFSYPMFCEWCNYYDVEWVNSNCYDCPRCNHLLIGKYDFDKNFEIKQ